MITFVSILLTIVGGISWLLIGIFDINIITTLFYGDWYFVARIIYALVGIASLWTLYYTITIARTLLKRRL